jgi:hypothetical protein
VGRCAFDDKDLTIDESKTIARTPKAQVVDFILKELDEAAAALPVNTAWPMPTVAVLLKVQQLL